MSLTKEQLIRYFSELDVAVLEKLKRYSELLIIPDDSLLSAVTMIQMVDKAHTLADSLFPEWTDRSKSDFGEFLVELFSLFSEKDFWYINAFANENILRKMRSYSNAFCKASSLAYEAQTCKGAKANFEVTFAAGLETTYGRGELIITVDGKEFTNDKEFVVPQSSASTTQVVVLKEGKQVSEDVAYNGYGVFIKKENVDIDSIEVSISNITYSRVGNFGNSQPTSHHFLVIPEEDGSCVIYFGADGFGIQPAIGVIVTVGYRTCKGSDGNFTSSVDTRVSITDSIPTREATDVAILGNATEGQYAESLTSIREKASSVNTKIRSAFNKQAAEDILNSYSFVKKSNVFVQGGVVYYLVIPINGDTDITSAQQAELLTGFVPCLMLGYEGSYTPNTYVDFLDQAGLASEEADVATKLKLNVVSLSGYSTDVIAREIMGIFEDITDPLIDAEYGDAFKWSETEILIRSKVKGVQSVAFSLVVNGSDVAPEDLNDFTIDRTTIFSRIDRTKLEFTHNVV